MRVLDHGAGGVRRGGGYRALFGEGEGVGRGGGTVFVDEGVGRGGVPSSLVRGMTSQGRGIPKWRRPSSWMRGDDVTGEGGFENFQNGAARAARVRGRGG